MNLSHHLRLLALALIAVLGPACGESGDLMLKAVLLSGRQESPPVTTTATGNATCVINAARTEVAVTVEVSGLTDITLAHIHFGKPGASGPILFMLSAGSFTSPLNLTLTAADLMPATGIATFDDAVNAMRNGDTYVNVHTLAHSDGEIRGQVGPVALSAVLDGAHETPPLTTTSAMGNFTATLSSDQSRILVTLSTTGLTNITAAHIHVEAIGVAGPIIFFLASGPYSSPLTAMLTSTDLTTQPSKGVSNFNEAVDAMLAGQTYVNVHTAAHLDGEIRGQIGP